MTPRKGREPGRWKDGRKEGTSVGSAVWDGALTLGGTGIDTAEHEDESSTTVTWESSV